MVVRGFDRDVRIDGVKRIPNRIENVVSFHREDLVWCIYFVVMFAGVYICRFRGDFKAYYFPEIWQKALSGWSVAALVTAAAGMLAPVAYDSYFLMSVRDMGQMGDGEKGDA